MSYGEREADGVYALGGKLLGEARGGHLVPDHHGHDQAPREDVETELWKSAAEMRGVVAQVVPQLGGALNQVERGLARGDDHRRDAVREEVGAGALAEDFTSSSRAADVAAAAPPPPCRLPW